MRRANTITTYRDSKELKYVETIVLYNYAVTPDELHSRVRDNRCAHARFIAWYLLKKKLHWTSPKIGAAFDRDHTTVVDGIHALRRMGLFQEAEQIWSSANTSGYPPIHTP